MVDVALGEAGVNGDVEVGKWVFWGPVEVGSFGWLADSCLILV